MKPSIYVTIGLAALAVLPGCASPTRDTPLSSGSSGPGVGRTPTGGEPYHGMIQYRAQDAKEAIVDPELVDADEALIAAGTKVIGVTVQGEARAYPLFILNNHQIVNDRVGGVPISASW